MNTEHTTGHGSRIERIKTEFIRKNESNYSTFLRTLLDPVCALFASKQKQTLILKKKGASPKWNPQFVDELFPLFLREGGESSEESSEQLQTKFSCF